MPIELPSKPSDYRKEKSTLGSATHPPGPSASSVAATARNALIASIFQRGPP